jgi:hypothetical protein
MAMPREREMSYLPVVTYTTVAGTARPTMEWVDGMPVSKCVYFFFCTLPEKLPRIWKYAHSYVYSRFIHHKTSKRDFILVLHKQFKHTEQGNCCKLREYYPTSIISLTLHHSNRTLVVISLE